MVWLIVFLGWWGVWVANAYYEENRGECSKKLWRASNVTESLTWRTSRGSPSPITHSMKSSCHHTWPVSRYLQLTTPTLFTFFAYFIFVYRCSNFYQNLHLYIFVNKCYYMNNINYSFYLYFNKCILKKSNSNKHSNEFIAKRPAPSRVSRPSQIE